MADLSSAIQRASPLQDPNWDTKINELAGATFFHTASWARVLHHTYGFEPAYFVTSGPRGIQSLLPAMQVNSWLTGRRGVALPFTDECAPLASSAEAFQALWDQARQFATQRNWKYLEFRGGAERLSEAKVAVRFHGHSLDLQGGESSLFHRFDPAVRRAIRKAEQNKLTIEISHSLAAVETFHRLLCKTRKRQGVPPQPFRFFRNIHRHVIEPKHGRVVLAHMGGKPIAGAIFIHAKKTATFKYGASDGTFQHLRPNNLVMWNAIRLYAAEGYQTLDFGRTSLENTGLRKFKLSWGAREREVEYFRYNVRTGSFMTARDRSSGWYSIVFRNLPITLSRAFGAMFYNHAA